GIDKPSVYHAAIIIFLEFFSWGLLTSPLIKLLAETFPKYTFLINGIIQGIKGILSFFSSPLIGSLSDSVGRKPFLLLTVFCTCIPIPVMWFDALSYFVVFTLSGMFSVTYSIVFAYVADISPTEERSSSYGLVSATFAASLIISPALGTYISDKYSDDVVVFIATAISFLDVLFILVMVPESLSSELTTEISWKKADPFASLKVAAKDPKLLFMCVMVFLSYLPEAGEYSCIFLYLRQVIGLPSSQVAILVGVTGIMSVIAQTWLMSIFSNTFGIYNTVIIGMICQIIQLLLYGLSIQPKLMWIACIFAAISSITYPTLNAIISVDADKSRQGVVQGMVTGVRGLCSGLGPAYYGLIFYAYHVNIASQDVSHNQLGPHKTPNVNDTPSLPGPPFVFSTVMVLIALLMMVRRAGKNRLVQVPL
ncbi:uncharacterized protein TRIADDRAFT_28065, partial [Trichoplax adhaerens]